MPGRLSVKMVLYLSVRIPLLEERKMSLYWSIIYLIPCYHAVLIFWGVLLKTINKPVHRHHIRE